MRFPLMKTLNDPDTWELSRIVALCLCSILFVVAWFLL